MDKSENLKDVDKLYIKVCKAFKKCGISPIPAREDFYLQVKRFNALVEGHKALLFAIGEL